MRQRNEQEQQRFDKLTAIRQVRNAYPNDVKVTAKSTTILALEDVGTPETAPRFTIAGRITQRRMMGKACFLHLIDIEGKLQVYVRSDDVGLESYEEFKDVDLGDIIEVSGYPFVTKTGEKTLYAESWRLLTKSLIPLPEKWHGLSDVDTRYRYRYVDLISNPEVREVFKKRSAIVRYIRNFLDERDYLEVETPILSDVASGAIARPFKSFYNALDTEVHLRIALELPLKKLVVGGLERVYEIGKNFRNEGLSRKHNPEFTMLEFYQAYATYNDLMDLTEELLVGLTKKVCGDSTITVGDKTVNFEGPYLRVTMKDSIQQLGGVSKEFNLDSLDDVKKVAEQHKIHLSNPNDWGVSIENLFDELVEDKIVNPTFITQHPFAISPFARQNDHDPRVTDRFELFVAGMEIANAFSELNDPEDQLARLLKQAADKDAGNHEVADMDDDYIKALEYGLPPTAGQGIGIDRLTMLLTNSSTIREVILFPQLKPLANGEEESMEATSEEL